MVPIDRQLVTRRVKLIEQDLSTLAGVGGVSLDEYLGSLDIRLKAERLLERIIGRVIDINYHILKEKFHHLPADYYQSFVEMGKRGVLDRELAHELAQTTGLRNALAHEYDAIDDTQVHAAIAVCLDQIPRYLAAVMEID